MKWLKKYKLFESDDLRKYYGDKVIDECDEQIKVIKDLLLELSDKYYTCKVGYIAGPSSYMLDPAVKMSWKPVIEISISKLTTSDFLDGYVANPLYNNDDEKMDFDAIILDVLRYGVGEGYKYKCEEIKSPTRFGSIYGKVTKYSIYLYKEKND